MNSHRIPKPKLVAALLCCGLALGLAACADWGPTDAAPPMAPQAAAPEAAAAPAPAPTPEAAAPAPAAPTTVVDNWDMPQVAARTLPVTQVEVETPPHYTGVPEPEYQDTSGKDCFRTWDENGREHAVCMAPPTHGRGHH